MGAKVWKRGTCSSEQSSGQQHVQQAATQQQHPAAGQQEADAHRPHKKLRTGEPTATVAQGYRNAPQSQARLVQHHGQAANGAAEVHPSKSGPSGCRYQQQPDSVAAPAEQYQPDAAGAPAEQQQQGSNRGRGRGRGGAQGRGPGGRNPAATVSHAPSETPTSAAGQQHVRPARGALHHHSTGRGSGRMDSTGRGGGRGRVGPAQPHLQQQQAATHTAAAQQQQQQQQAAEEALLKKQQEMEALKAKIREQQAKKDALKAAQEFRQQQESQQQKLEQRKKGLNSAFGSAFANAAKAKQEQSKQQAAAPAAAGPTAATAHADEAEVKRVLASKNDYDVLQLKPGCDAAALKQRYREMAVRLHPDKCRAENAKDAFQRANKAYQVLKEHVM